MASERHIHGNSVGDGPDNYSAGRRHAFCVYINTLIDGPIPADRDEKGNPAVYGTRVEAEQSIVSLLMVRLQEFMDGEREYDDAMTVEEYIVEVDVLPDGSIVDSEDNHFGSNPL